MRNMVLSTRYARALYNLARESNQQDAAFHQIRLLAETFRDDKEIREFVLSPVIRPSEKEKVMEKLVSTIEMVEPVKNFVRLLARKNRLSIFESIVEAYQKIADEAHGVTRGVVRSATVLGPEDRKQLEQLVSRATKKQVILTYKEDPTLLGGLVAEVGSFTFDDSLVSHLSRIHEQLTRSAH